MYATSVLNGLVLCLAADSEKTKPAAECEEIVYPKPDGKLSFELLSNLSRSGTNHEDQPSHLRIKPEFADIPANESFPVYAGPEQRFCPAKVIVVVVICESQIALMQIYRRPL